MVHRAKCMLHVIYATECKCISAYQGDNCSHITCFITPKWMHQHFWVYLKRNTFQCMIGVNVYVRWNPIPCSTQPVHFMIISFLEKLEMVFRCTLHFHVQFSCCWKIHKFHRKKERKKHWNWANEIFMIYFVVFSTFSFIHSMYHRNFCHIHFIHVRMIWRTVHRAPCIQLFYGINSIQWIEFKFFQSVLPCYDLYHRQEQLPF